MYLSRCKRELAVTNEYEERQGIHQLIRSARPQIYGLKKFVIAAFITVSPNNPEDQG